MAQEDTMNRSMTRLGLLVGLVLILGGCATVTREAAFEDVQVNVQERTGQDVRWRQGTAADEKVDQQVRELLAGELSADAAVQIALLNNPRLQARYEELGLAQASLVQAGLLSNPVFHAALLYEGGVGGSPELLDAGISLNFLNVLMVPLRKQLAEAEFENAKLRVTGAVMDLASEVRAAFYGLQAEEQRLGMFRQIVAGMEAAHDFARRLHAAGNISDLAYAGEQAAYESAKVDLAAAETAAASARERMNVLMGLWGGDTQWTVAPRLPDVPGEETDVEAVEKRAVERSIDLQIARGNLERAARQLGITDSTRIVSDLELGIAGEREEGHWTRGPSFGFNIPIFDVGQGRRGASQAAMRRSQQEYLATAVEVRSAARRAAYVVESARRRAAHLRDVVVPLRSRILSESMLHYNAMQVGLPQLLLARQQEIDAGGRYVDALRDYWLARGGLDQILNGRLVDTGGAMAGAGAPMPGMQAESGGH
jgi:cobalt-zinc-cadmium efflux system outer membrane protein